MALISDDDVRSFAESGYLLVAGLVSTADCGRANTSVDALIAEDPRPAGHVGQHFYFREPAQSPALVEFLRRPDGVLDTVADLVGVSGVEPAFNHVQVALNIPPNPLRPGRPHIDGYRRGLAAPGTFTLLVGLMLSDQEGENNGNLWVWPGTHRAHASFFAARGPEAFAEAAGYPDVDLPEPVQVCGRTGDVLFAHYLLGHNIGGNDQGRRVRRALYVRLRARGHGERWAECLADPWVEYPRVRDVLDARI